MTSSAAPPPPSAPAVAPPRPGPASVAGAAPELRDYAEQLARSHTALQTLADRYQELFLAVPWPMAVTDCRGAVLARNRAAADMLREAPPHSQDSIATWFLSADRSRVRSLIVRALARTRPLELTARVRTTRFDSGRVVAVRVTPFREAGDGEARLSWDLRPVAARPGVSDGQADGSGVALPGPATAPVDGTVGSDGPVGVVAEAARMKQMFDRLVELDAAVTRPSFEPVEIAQTEAARVLQVISGADRCTVSLLDENGVLSTTGGSDPHVAAWDALQQQLGQGPTVSALSHGGVVRSGDVAREWPVFAARAGEAAPRSAVAVRFPVGRGLRGALTAWSSRPAAFDVAAATVLPVMASRLGTALQYADKVANLQRALASRQLIGQACGVLMERHRLPAETAFERLVDASQKRHVKISRLAAAVLDSGLEPDDVP